MCGILAVLSGEDTTALRKKVLDLSRRLRHRGPDWSGIHQVNGNYLAHERLAIIDPASGHQPLFGCKKHEAEEVIVTVNGEIYNHAAIKESLGKHHSWNTASDCEVIAHLYEDFGEGCVSKLDGMFAFVLYDTKKSYWMAARDAIGIIPLYIGWGRDGSVWVASELKALKDDCESFQQFPPGHLYSSAEKKFVRWYTAPWVDEAYLPTTAVDMKALRVHFESAVVSHMMSDVPFGVLLSGGLDSSLVAAVATRHIAKHRTEMTFADKLHSFAVGLKTSPDLVAAREVAAFLGTKHHEFHFTVQEGIDALSDVIYHIETFDVTSIRASTPMFLMARKIKALGVKMVLSGEGSDEIFGGYLYFHKAPNAKELHKETRRKLLDLYKYDCLRANKSTSAWGVEARVPFLDKTFLEYAMSIDPADKLIDKAKGRIEKWVLRKAFEDKADPYLPAHILWRQKEQFSDGVGYGWIDGLKDYAASQITDQMMASAGFRFPETPPQTKEAYLYRELFERHFPQPSARSTVPGGPSVACSTAIAAEWDLAWKNNFDQSGRAVAGVHDAAYQNPAAESTAAGGQDGKAKAKDEPAPAAPPAKKSRK